MSWLSAVNTFIDRIGLPGGQKNGHSPEEIVTDLYWGLLEREPDRVGLQSQAGLLHGGTALEHVVRGFIASPEFRARMLAALVPPTDLPDLTQAKNGNGRSPEEIVTGLYRGLLGRDPDRLGLQDQAGSLHAGTALEHVVRSFVGSPEFRARMLAALVRALGARSCFELGCFTGPVLSLLSDSGVSVAGVDVSHLAFAFAYPNIRDSMIYGDLLGLDIAQRFDVVLCMDVLEHISPLRLDAYIDKILSILAEDGYVYMNSPMWCRDSVFGVV